MYLRKYLRKLPGKSAYPIGSFALLSDITIRKVWLLFIFLMVWMIPTASVQAGDAVKPAPVLCYSDVLDDYNAFIKDKSPLELEDYSGEKSRRDVIELVILQQALKLGGFGGAIEFHTISEITHKRAVSLMGNGDFVAMCNTVWRSPAAKLAGIESSSIVIPAHQFVAGFFAREERAGEIKIKTLEDVRRYKILCNPNWTQDQLTIDAMKLNCVEAQDWNSMVNMLEKGRADFMLAPFQSTPDGSLEAYGFRFKPVPGVKAKLDDDRVFMVSKAHGQGKAFYDALQKGLAIMEADGRLDKAYTDSGFYNQATADWILLNP